MRHPDGGQPPDPAAGGFPPDPPFQPEEQPDRADARIQRHGRQHHQRARSDQRRRPDPSGTGGGAHQALRRRLGLGRLALADAAPVGVLQARARGRRERPCLHEPPRGRDAGGRAAHLQLALASRHAGRAAPGGRDHPGRHPGARRPIRQRCEGHPRPRSADPCRPDAGRAGGHLSRLGTLPARIRCQPRRRHPRAALQPGQPLDRGRPLELRRDPRPVDPDRTRDGTGRTGAGRRKLPTTCSRRGRRTGPGSSTVSRTGSSTRSARRRACIRPDATAQKERAGTMPGPLGWLSDGVRPPARAPRTPPTRSPRDPRSGAPARNIPHRSSPPSGRRRCPRPARSARRARDTRSS